MASEEVLETADVSFSRRALPKEAAPKGASSYLLVVPLLLHLVSTSIVCFIAARYGLKYYLLAIAAGTIIHTTYNLLVMGAML